MPITNQQILDLVPDGYFRRYLDLMGEWNNEMPLAFHFLTIATVLGNKIGFRHHSTLDRGVKVFPNINCILMSPAGRARRGEGSKFAVKVAQAAGMNLHEGKTTPEGLCDRMREEEDLLLYVEELSVLFSKRDFLRDIIPTLTKMLLNSGCVIEEQTRTMGRLRIERCNLSCIFTTAPDWFLTTMPEEAQGGGLMSRFIGCYLPDREVVHCDIGAGRHAKDDRVWGELGMELSSLFLNSPQGFFPPTPEAIEWFNHYYNTNETRLVHDDRMDPSRNRAPANVLRIGMLLAVSCGERELGAGRLEQARKLVDLYEMTMYDMYGFTDEKGRGVDKAKKRIRAVLADGPLQHSDFMRKVLSYAGGLSKLKEVASEMQECGEIKRWWKEGSVGVWPPVKWGLVGEEKKNEEVS